MEHDATTAGSSYRGTCSKPAGWTRPVSARNVMHVIWTGSLEWHDRSRSIPNDQKQMRAVDCHILAQPDANLKTDIWPKQLIMQVIPHKFLQQLGTLLKNNKTVLFSFPDKDSDMQSYRALIRSTQKPFAGLVHIPVEGPSRIRVLILLYSLQRHQCVGLIPIDQAAFVNTFRALVTRHKNNHEQMPAKEIARLKEELQQKDNMLVEQQMLHQEEAEMLITMVTEKEKEQARVQRERDMMQREIIKKDTALFMKDSALKEKDQALMKKDEAIFDSESALVVKETDLMEKEITIMTVKQEKDELQQENNELVTDALIMQAALDDVQKELECGICMEPLTKATMLDCGHSFCDGCIQKSHKEDRRCPHCFAPLETYEYRPCFNIDGANKVIKETRKRKGELIQGEQEVLSQSMSEESDDESSPVSSPSSFASSFCRARSSIENMFSPASSPDSNQGDVTEGEETPA